ncbi:MAG: replicative DNA helicase [Cryomorphaceae bacterium]|jgi:replicative DNA helicase|nr:replicative DNA helicase [Cryomorphaceae bacterium]MBT4222008.1 replicative DNA helicase [Cryomorphaceae bacterium]MBT4294010.1 replicative DNA helicase [Cryomorphaceae bacterium]MBT4517439.1 replicative DNA helicase [Cryomorphaceae bacterium]MBT4834968.1 replicative DNA helicase [Cryomorphaceae bacterium]
MQKRTPLKIYETEDQAVVNLSDGKIPPQAIDLEEAVLGAMLIDEKGVNEIIELLSPEVFYKRSHQLIYESVERLFRESEPIDLLTVSADLKKNKNFESAGGDFYLISLSQKVSSSAHIEFHSRIILQKYIQRKLITISNEIIQKSYNESTDVMDLLDEAESKLYDVAQGNIKTSTESAQNLVIRAKTRIEEIAKQEGLSGVSTGFEKLDKLTSGWQPSDLVIVAARPGMGKTALALSMARNISVQQKIPVAFFSLEMSSVQLITRLISSETGLSSDKLRTGKLADHEWQQLNIKVSDLESAPLYIDDSPSLTIFELRAKARRLASSHGIKLIIIDYLQLMNIGSSNKAGNREQEISTISRNLKALAKELDIPVIALSQLSRAVETRGGTKRPILSDLRESGAIEQDADIVSFLYRPEYYGITEWDDDMKTPSEGQGEFIVAKHRNGALDSIKLKFIANLGKFEDLGGFDSPFEFQSKLNPENKLSDFSEPSNKDDDDDMPF